MAVVMALGAALVLASCGFSPMYAEGDGGGAAAAWEQVDVASPGNRLSQLVYAELLRNRPPERMGGGAYELKFSVQQDKAPLLGDRLERVRLSVDYALVERASGRVLMQGRTFADASYEKTRQHFADEQARENAQRTAARQVAEDLRTRVAAFFSRGMPVAAAAAAPPAR